MVYLLSRKTVVIYIRLVLPELSSEVDLRRGADGHKGYGCMVWIIIIILKGLQCPRGCMMKGMHPEVAVMPKGLHYEGCILKGL